MAQFFAPSHIEVVLRPGSGCSKMYELGSYQCRGWMRPTPDCTAMPEKEHFGKNEKAISRFLFPPEMGFK